MSATRVVMLVTDLKPGGTPNRLVRWSQWVRDAGIDPIVGCLAPRGPLHDTLDAAGITNFACTATSPRDIGVVRRLAAELKKHDPDILHSFLFHANVAARLVGHAGRRRAIITSTATIEVERKWHLRLERWTRRRSTLHMCNSPSVARHVIEDLKFDPDRVRVIPNGIDLQAMDAIKPAALDAIGLRNDVPVIAWVGRMDRIKGLDTWIEAFDRVARNRSVQGLLIGEGPQRNKVSERLRGLDRLRRSAIDSSDAVGRVTLAGWQDHPAAWLKSAAVMMFPSRTEGSPNALIESMAIRCPVVASDIPACRDLISDGTTGLLCPVGDPVAFATAVERVLDDPAAATARANAARLMVAERHEKSAVTAQIVDCYRSVLTQI